MRNLVLGLQFGDEGKGKVTDFISQENSVLVRYNGGTNAGHTVVTKKGKFKFHLLPAGSLKASSIVLGNGMVIEPEALVNEISDVLAENPHLKIHISSAAHVVTRLHKYMDGAQEKMRGEMKIGTTSHGIGPTYEEKYSRNGIRVEDLGNRDTVLKKLSFIRELRSSELTESPFNNEELEKIADELHEKWQYFRSFVGRTEYFLFDAVSKNEHMVFEGGHGTMLDIDFGTYPYVTSSNTISGALHTGTGISLRKIDRIIGVVKAYTSRVGEGPFPTELHGKDADLLREAGGEYGTTTGRPRRVGWLDIPLVNYAAMLNDVDEIAITKLDVLGQFRNIRICTSYGKNVKEPVNALLGKEKAEPEYVEMDSWGKIGEGEIEQIVESGYDAVPEEMKNYISTVERLTGKPVKIVSIGQIRESTVVRK